MNSLRKKELIKALKMAIANVSLEFDTNLKIIDQRDTLKIYEKIKKEVEKDG